MTDEKNVKPQITILHAEIHRPREADLVISTHGAISASPPLAKPLSPNPRPPENEK